MKADRLPVSGDASPRSPARPERSSVGNWAPLLAMLGTLAVAYGLDRWLESARSPAVARVSVVTYQWAVLLANLVFAACILGCGWLLLAGHRRRRLAALFLALGLLVILLPTPPFWSLGLGAPASVAPLVMASPHSLFGHTGAFLAVMGLAALIWPAGGPRRG